MKDVNIEEHNTLWNVVQSDTIVTSTMQSRIVPYSGECSFHHHTSACMVYKVSYQPIYRTTSRLNYITQYKCCYGWKRVGQKCEKVPTTAPKPPQGPIVPNVGYPIQPGLGGRGQRPNPGHGIGHRGFGPGAFKPRPGFGAPTTTESPPNRGGQGGRPSFNPRPGFGPGSDRGFGPRTETGTGGGGRPNVGMDPGYGFQGTQIPDYSGGPQYPQGPQFGTPPLTPNPPGSRGHIGVNAGRGRPNNGGPGNGIKPGVIPGRFPDKTKGNKPTEEDKKGSGHMNTSKKSGSIVTIMGALLGVFGLFGLGALLMMYLSRTRDTSGRRSVRLRRSSLRDAAGRDSSEAHKSWKFSIYQFRLQ
nr:translation initiation factor IF-2-like [Lytechinus pictus]